MTKTPKNRTDNSESALRMASSMLESGLEGLQSYVDHIAEIVAESRDVEVASDFAHLLTKIAQVSSELRKAEAAERKAAEGISDAEVLEWFRRLDQVRQSRFLRELQNAAGVGKRSGLA